jgi:hypothetical protein
MKPWPESAWKPWGSEGKSHGNHILNDALAQEVTTALTIGCHAPPRLLLQAYQAGLVSTSVSFLDRLQALRFRLSSRTRAVLLAQTGKAAKQSST